MENNFYPGSESNDREKEIIESANSDHRQFKSEYKKASEKLTSGKMKRLIRKLSMLLWTIRSNMVHGSKIAMDDEEYQNRTEVISELTIRVLFEVINSLFAGGLKNFAVYGELRLGHPLFNEYMRKSEFRGLGYITGLEWRDSNDTKWIEVGAAQNQISSELYSVNELNFFKPLDLLEKAAERKFTEFNSDSKSVFAWVYS